METDFVQNFRWSLSPYIANREAIYVRDSFSKSWDKSDNISGFGKELQLQTQDRETSIQVLYADQVGFLNSHYLGNAMPKTFGTLKQHLSVISDKCYLL